jgi:hypothetical protein
MRSHTIRDLGMNVNGEKFVLPFDVSTPYEGILMKTRDLFANRDDFIYCFNVDKNVNVEIDEKWDSIRIPCLYEGNDGYYPYFIVVVVFRLKYDNEQRLYFKEEKNKNALSNDVVPNDQWMIALTTECSEGALLEELVELKVLPNVIEKLGLKKCAYRFY